MTQLSPNFSFDELVFTNHRSLAEENYIEGLKHGESLVEVARMLQEVRDHFNSVVIVHSGYRCPALNVAIGGSKTSQHMRGQAADFHVVGHSLFEVFDWIRLESGVPFGQVILEGAVAGKPTWIHLSLGEPYRAADKCRQAFTWSAKSGYVRI